MWRSRLKSQNRAGDRLSSLRPIKWEKQVAGQFIWDTIQYLGEKKPTKVYIYEDLNMWESIGGETLWGNTPDKKNGSPRTDIQWPRGFLYELELRLIEQLCASNPKISNSESRSVVSDSLPPHGLYSPWNSPGQNAGVGSLSLLQGVFPTQGSNPGLPHCGWILHQLSHKGSS